MTVRLFPDKDGVVQAFEVYVEVRGGDAAECERIVQKWLDLAPEGIVLTAVDGFVED
jgi:hypothetical protein